MYMTESKQLINDLLKDMNIEYSMLKPNEYIDVSFLNYQLLTRNGMWNDILKVIRKNDDVKYNIIYDDVILECSSKHAIIVKDINNNESVEIVEKLYKNENNFKLNKIGRWINFKIEKTTEIIPIIDFELGGDHTYLSNDIISHNTMFGDHFTTSGGKGLPFAASVRIRLKSIGQLKIKTASGDQVIGIKVRAQVIKNRVGPPFRTADFDVFFDRGIDDSENWLQILKDADVVTRSSPGFKMVDHKGEERKFITEDWSKILNGDNELKEFLYQKICDIVIMKYRSISDIGGLDAEIISTDEVIGEND